MLFHDSFPDLPRELCQYTEPILWQWHAKLVVFSVTNYLTLQAFGSSVTDIAQDYDATKEGLMSALPFTLTYDNTIITSIQRPVGELTNSSLPLLIVFSVADTKLYSFITDSFTCISTSKVTAPQDAHGRLVLQVYLGSNTLVGLREYAT